MNVGRHRHFAHSGKHKAALKELSRHVRQAAFNAAMSAGVQSGEHVALTVERAAEPTAPERMARNHPGDAAQRAETRAMYERCLTQYRTSVQSLDDAHDDAGVAVAHFVATCMRALHAARAAPGTLLQLERQLSGVVERSANWSTASKQERQFYFEQMAILAVLISESNTLALTQGPAALANVQRAASGYLQKLLGLDPRVLSLDTQGLRLADHVHGADQAAA